jgi:hypothetical protein
VSNAKVARSDKARTPHDATFWLNVCRKHANDPDSLFKQADIGGAGNDVPFAQAFSNLSHAFLRDKAPSLLDHELGFQIVDRSADDKKAVGVLAARIGTQKVFVPFFFLKNKVKGHELLYLCERDLFVPLKENWLDDLRNRKPDIIGTGINRSEATRNLTNPNLQRLRQAPYKSASHVIPAVAPFLPKLGSLVAQDAWQEEITAAASHFSASLSLPEFLKTANNHMLGQLVHWLQRYPKLAAAIDQTHGMDKIASVIRETAARNHAPSVLSQNLVPKYHAAPVSGSIWDAEERAAKQASLQKVKVTYLDAIVGDTDPTHDYSLPAAADLTDAEREKLALDRYVIRDERGDEEVTKPYKLKGTQQLFNPAESGVYMVLVRPGKFEKCFIAMHPYGPTGRTRFSTVVRLSEPHNWVNMYSGNLWCESMLDITDFSDWFKSLPDVGEFDTGSTKYICLGDRGEATLPFNVEKALGDGDEPLYDVSFSRHCDDRAPGRIGIRGEPPMDEADNYDPWVHGQRIRIAGRAGSRIRSNRGDVIVPPGYKVLVAQPAARDEYSDDELIPRWGTSNSHSDNPAVQPGNFVDAERIFKEKTAALRITHDGSEYRVNDSARLTKIAALVHLVRDHGLREETARHLLDSTSMSRPFNCRLKYADPYLTDRGPTAPAVPDMYTTGYNPMGFDGEVSTTQGWRLPVAELSAFNTDRNKYNPNPRYDDAPFYPPGGRGGSDSGGSQRENLDLSVISSLLRSMNDDSLVDRWLPDLLVGMDRLGRLLFTFYWHGDRFEDRYGKRDMPELEDSLRNAFEMVGDVVIFLQQKTVRANPEESLRALDLGPAAGI